MVSLFLKLKSWAWAIGAAALAILAAIGRMSVLKQQRDSARRRADLAEARAHVADVEKRIKKKRKKELSTSLEEVERKVKEKKVEELDNLINPNDNW